MRAPDHARGRLSSAASPQLSCGVVASGHASTDHCWRPPAGAGGASAPCAGVEQARRESPRPGRARRQELTLTAADQGDEAGSYETGRPRRSQAVDPARGYSGRTRKPGGGDDCGGRGRPQLTCRRRPSYVFWVYPGAGLRRCAGRPTESPAGARPAPPSCGRSTSHTKSLSPMEGLSQNRSCGLCGEFPYNLQRAYISI